MIEFVLAVALAQPCLAPHPIAHRVHHGVRIVPEPVQSCIVPPVPMCFQTPVAVPDEIVLPPLPYYTDSPPLSTTIPVATNGFYSGDFFIGGGYGGFVGGVPFGGGGGGGISTAPAPPTEPTSPPVDYPPAPPRGYLPPPRTKAQAPELGVSGAAGAMTLLLGSMIVFFSGKRGIAE